MLVRFSILFAAVSALLLSGCGSAMKQRKEQRDKVANSSKLYCDFVNGELFPADVEVALNLEMAKRCEADKSFSITTYKTPSENNGVLFCCTLSSTGLKPASASAAEAKQPDAKKDEIK